MSRRSMLRARSAIEMFSMPSTSRAMSASPRARSRSTSATPLPGSQASVAARLTATLVVPTPPREPRTEMTWAALDGRDW